MNSLANPYPDLSDILFWFSSPNSHCIYRFPGCEPVNRIAAGQAAYAAQRKPGSALGKDIRIEKIGQLGEHCPPTILGALKYQVEVAFRGKFVVPYFAARLQPYVNFLDPAAVEQVEGKTK